MRFTRRRAVPEPMTRSWLVQRLEPPRGRHNPFAFGGGRINGGLTSEGMDLLRSVWSFDYMGAAEYEWGAVPEALERILKSAKHYRLHTFDIEFSEVSLPWDMEKAPSGSGRVYALCPEEWRTEVEERIREWAWEPERHGEVPKHPIRDYTYLNHALLPSDQEWTRACGWLELDNGFLFFTDEEMCMRAMHLFGMEAD